MPDFIPVDEKYAFKPTEAERLEVSIRGGTLIFDQKGLRFEAVNPEESWDLDTLTIRLLGKAAQAVMRPDATPDQALLCKNKDDHRKCRTCPCQKCMPQTCKRPEEDCPTCFK